MTMYKLKPVYVDAANVELPTCMYKMKNLHESVSEEAMTPEMKALETRQFKILGELQNLTNEMKDLSKKLGHKFGDELSGTKCSAPAASTTTTTTKSVVKLQPTPLAEGIHDFVISVSPSQQALSSVLLAELLQCCGVNIATSTHLHSSLTEKIADEKLNVTGGLTGRLRISPEQLIFTFIWKNEPFSPSLMYATLNQTKICGDVNIARHLCRILAPQLYDETMPVESALIDLWLDLSKQLLHGNTKEKDAVMKSLNSHLGKNEYLALNRLTIADICALSGVLSSKDLMKTLPKNVKAWFARVGGSFPKTVGKFNIPSNWTA